MRAFKCGLCGMCVRLCVSMYVCTVYMCVMACAFCARESLWKLGLSVPNCTSGEKHLS